MRNNSHHQVTVLLFMCASLSTGPALLGDKVLLSNGRTITGIVIRNLPENLELDLGTGVMTISKDKVASVELASPAENNALRQIWKTRHPTYKNFIPSGLEDMAGLISEVSAKRAEASRAETARKSALQKESALVGRVEQTRRLILAVAKQLQNLRPEDGIAAYNSLVRELNRLSAEYATSLHELEEFRASIPSASAELSAYINALESLRSAHKKATDTSDPNDSDRMRFLDAVGRIILEASSDLNIAVAEGEKSTSGIVVMARVNDSLSGRFLVDTGAAITSISEEFAARLNIETEGLPTAEMIVADGRKVSAKVVILSSVAVGSAKASNIEAAIMPNISSDNINGLLGMSFLSRFSVRLDPAAGQLILTDLLR